MDSPHYILLSLRLDIYRTKKLAVYFTFFCDFYAPEEEYVQSIFFTKKAFTALTSRSKGLSYL